MNPWLAQVLKTEFAYPAPLNPFPWEPKAIAQTAQSVWLALTKLYLARFLQIESVYLVLLDQLALETEALKVAFQILRFPWETKAVAQTAHSVWLEHTKPHLALFLQIGSVYLVLPDQLALETEAFKVAL
jgi:hypothetical protein